MVFLFTTIISESFPILRFSKTTNLKIFKKIKDRSSQANNNIHVDIKKNVDTDNKNNIYNDYMLMMISITISTYFIN